MSISKEKITTVFPRSASNQACDLANKYAGINSEQTYRYRQDTYLIIKY